MILLYLIGLFVIKILLTKIINLKDNQISNSHKYSTLITIMLFLIYESYLGILIFQDLLLLTLNFIIFSYIFITFPGGYASSIRLKILSKLINKKKAKKFFNLKFSDLHLFEDRLSRLQRYDLIIKKKKKYYFKSKQIFFFIKFIDLNRLIFHKIKK